MDLGNYRPISILSLFNKIFDTILRRRLVDFGEKTVVHKSSTIWLSKKIFC